MQVRGDRHGGSGPAADGLSLSEHQTLCGELPAHGGQTAGVQRTGPAGPWNQLGKTRGAVNVSTGQHEKLVLCWRSEPTAS